MDIKLLVARLLPITALLFSVRVFSAPYATTYTSIQVPDYDEPLPDYVAEGESFKVTLVMDNGGASATSQSWRGDDLQCLIFEFNDARDVIWAIDLVAYPPVFAANSADTDDAGAFTRFFGSIYGGGSSGEYTEVGFSNPPGEVEYYLIDANNVFIVADSNGDPDGEVGDAAFGVQMKPANWSAPSPFKGDCVAAASPTISPGVLWFITRGTQFDEE